MREGRPGGARAGLPLLCRKSPPPGAARRRPHLCDFFFLDFLSLTLVADVAGARRAFVVASSSMSTKPASLLSESSAGDIKVKELKMLKFKIQIYLSLVFRKNGETRRCCLL